MLTFSPARLSLTAAALGVCRACGMRLPACAHLSISGDRPIGRPLPHSRFSPTPLNLSLPMPTPIQSTERSEEYPARRLPAHMAPKTATDERRRRHNKDDEGRDKKKRRRSHNSSKSKSRCV